MNDAVMHAVLDAVEIVDEDEQQPFYFRDEWWIERAACRGMDTELFYPGRGDDTSQAKATCQRCPVADECLDYALRLGEKWGVWGGRSERERRSLRRDGPKPFEHGTPNGYSRHYRIGEKPCDACRDAFNAYQRRLPSRRRGYRDAA